MVLSLLCAALRAQEPEREPSLEEKCEMETDRLQALLELEDWQAFYVDSILKHDYKAMQDEFDRFQKEKVSSIYIRGFRTSGWRKSTPLSASSLPRNSGRPI